MRKAPSSVIARSARSVIVLLLEAREADVRKSAADPADSTEKSEASKCPRTFPPRVRAGIFRAVSSITGR
jgi:hypothetical protein